jgi:hypothetical protein
VGREHHGSSVMELRRVVHALRRLDDAQLAAIGALTDQQVVAVEVLLEVFGRDAPRRPPEPRGRELGAAGRMTRPGGAARALGAPVGTAAAKKCVVCDRQVRQNPRGARRLYCGVACQRRAQEQRRAEREAAADRAQAAAILEQTAAEGYPTLKWSNGDAEA